MVDRAVASAIELDQAAVMLDERGKVVEVHVVVDIGSLLREASGLVESEGRTGIRRFDRC